MATALAPRGRAAPAPGGLGDGAQRARGGCAAPPALAAAGGFRAWGERWLEELTGHPSSGRASCRAAGETEADLCSEGC